ncbi:hypothetical protein [Chondrinema litorale]|uniref:hypothetical protein n=1 Tax=Chondrinema litorale TaxID=2994555 RepID=UPI002543CC05|nr:hypothetical protein [Chondrinema litorale]UZR99495.1 hypothetical protein OQ292_36500 [Chondrinema litorale]
MNKQEIIWLASTITFVLILIAVILDKDVFSLNSSISIQIHDAYYVINNLYVAIPIGVFLMFGVYFIRVLKSNYSDLTIDLIFLASLLLLMLSVFNLKMFVTSMEELSGGVGFPPLNQNYIEEPIESPFGLIENILSIFLLVLSLILIYSGYKTFKQFSSRS